MRQNLEVRKEEDKQEEPEPIKASDETEDIIESSQNEMTGKDFDYLKNVFEKHRDKAKKYY